VPTLYPFAEPTPVPFDGDPVPLIVPAAKPSPVQAWAGSVATAVRKVKSGRTVKVRIAAPAAGRLVVRVLDAKGRTLARGSARFSGEQRRTLTLAPVRRGARATISLRWSPATGAPVSLKRRF
jgi:hypothetical protein